MALEPTSYEIQLQKLQEFYKPITKLLAAWNQLW